MVNESSNYILPAGTQIENFEIQSLLGSGGFGITYKAIDKDLDCVVALKEYLPGEFAWRLADNSVTAKSKSLAEDYQYGLEQFVEEGRTLAKFKHPNIVRVTRYMRANGTAYLVMDYIEGCSLSDYLKTHGGDDEKFLTRLLRYLLCGLELVHQQGFLHRDIKPGNIYIPNDGEPFLIDFGAARQALGEHSKSITGIVTAGYAPIEQYGLSANLTPACDLYALGATIYRIILGAPPIDATERIRALQEKEPDPLTPAVRVGAGRYSQKFLEIVDWLVRPLSKDRPQKVDSVLCLLDALENTAPVSQSERETVANAEIKIPPASAAPRYGGVRFNAGLKTIAIVVSSVLVTWLIIIFFSTDDSEPLSNIIPVSDYKPSDRPAKDTGSVREIGSVIVKSEPEGAQIIIDGADAGFTPKTIRGIKTGPHMIELKKKGFVSSRKNLFVGSGTVEVFSSKLKVFTVPLNITVVPRTANIKMLNSTDKYKKGMQVKPGKFLVEVSHPGYRTRKAFANAGIGKTLQGTSFYLSNRILLDHNSLIEKFSLGKFGNGRRFYLWPKIKKAVVGSSWGIIYFLELDPDKVKGKQNNPHITSFSVGKSTKAVEVEGSEFIKPQKKVGLIRSIRASYSAYAVMKNKSIIVVGSKIGKVFLYDISSDRIVKSYDHKQKIAISEVALSGNEKQFACYANKQIYIWDVASGKQLQLLSLNERVRKMLFLSRKDGLIIVKKGEQIIKKISLLTTKISAEYKGHRGSITGLIHDQKHGRLISSATDKTIRIWDIRSAKPLGIIKTDKVAKSVSLSSDSRYIVAVYSRGDLTVWDSQSFKQINKISGIGRSPNYIVAGSEKISALVQDTILVWDLAKLIP